MAAAHPLEGVADLLAVVLVDPVPDVLVRREQAEPVGRDLGLQRPQPSVELLRGQHGFQVVKTLFPN